VEVARAGGSRGVRLQGSLQRVDARAAESFAPFARQRVEILWRESPSSAWTRAGYATTDAKGAFAHRAPDRDGGFWRVRFPGTGHYAPDTSQIHHITR
jgi:hypothetical protein